MTIDLNAIISTPERRAQFKQLCDRGLNTWDGAPQWLFELADAVSGSAKLQAAPQAQGEANRRAATELVIFNLQEENARLKAQQPAQGVGEVNGEFAAWVEREKENARNRDSGDDWIDNPEDQREGFIAGWEAHAYTHPAPSPETVPDKAKAFVAWEVCRSAVKKVIYDHRGFELDAMVESVFVRDINVAFETLRVAMYAALSTQQAQSKGGV